MSDAFRKSCELIRKLDALESAGLDESAEADAVRDELDGPWLLLTPDEKLELRRFSESLRTTGAVDLERGGSMKVYVVHQGDWDGGAVFGVFASFGEAQAYVDHAERLLRDGVDVMLRLGYPDGEVNICEREVHESFNPSDFEIRIAHREG